ncbi:flavin reductase (NADPH) [Amyelois transitella]|uniref:flavin reductase (NADPH) n=1 Tax=Amyelois transitella TaxID=680683 RepID=UPI00067C5842|nr:flavin reductase (NADPH) [Amyelois transitella]XP_013194256.1 flavin reductase (NADPH) [Amyelois transitella]XP_013194258.1 flavin reductase (NADPH) [Amyelois transitella]
MKKVVIFGSTGMTGLCALEAAVKKGLSVRAFVRDPSKVPENLRDKVEIVKGDAVSDPQSVKDAVEGMDAAIIILGTRNSLEPTTDLSVGTKNIIDALVEKNVTKMSVCMSAFLFYEPDKVPARFVDINADHERMFEIVKDCPLDWIAVFPPHISDEPSREIIVEVNPEKSPGRAVSKWDLGQFFVDCLSEPKYYKSVIGICNVPQ